MPLPWMTTPKFFVERGLPYLQYPSYPDYNNPWNAAPISLYEDHNGIMVNKYKAELDKCQERIWEGIAGIYRIDRGLPTMMWTEEVTSTTTKFKNGRLRKHPIVESEQRYVNSDGAKPENKEAIHRNIAGALRRGAQLVSSSFMKRWYNSKARLLDLMSNANMVEDREITATITLKKDKRYPCGYGENVEWSDLLTRSGRVRETHFYDDIAQFLPKVVFDEFKNRLEEFKWMARWGFIDELHCPRD